LNSTRSPGQSGRGVGPPGLAGRRAPPSRARCHAGGRDGRAAWRACRSWPRAARWAAPAAPEQPHARPGAQQVPSSGRSPPVGVLGGTPDTPPHGRSQAGDRHLTSATPGTTSAAARHSTLAVLAVVVRVSVVVGTLTGPLGGLSAARLAVVPAAVGSGAHLPPAVGQREADLRRERRVVGAEVGGESVPARPCHCDRDPP
jgi:hypothetical protein